MKRTDDTYQRVLDQMLTAGLSYTEAHKHAAAEAQRLDKAFNDTFSPLGSVAMRVVDGLKNRNVK